MINRRDTRTVKIGNVSIGSKYDIAIQSMTNTKTIDTENTIKQILELEKAGCNIVRIAIPDEASAPAIPAVFPFSAVATEPAPPSLPRRLEK